MSDLHKNCKTTPVNSHVFFIQIHALFTVYRIALLFSMYHILYNIRSIIQISHFSFFFFCWTGEKLLVSFKNRAWAKCNCIEFKHFNTDAMQLPSIVYSQYSNVASCFNTIFYSNLFLKSESNIAFSCHTSLIAFILKQFFNLCFSFLRLTFLKSTSSLVCKMSLNLSSSNCFFMVRFRLYKLSRNAT